LVVLEVVLVRMLSRIEAALSGVDGTQSAVETYLRCRERGEPFRRHRRRRRPHRE
jgi:hypothetical protein